MIVLLNMLRAAKKEYLSNASKALGHPFYWSAFEQFGNTQPISWSNARSTFSLLLYSLMACLGLLTMLLLWKKTGNNSAI